MNCSFNEKIWSPFSLEHKRDREQDDPSSPWVLWISKNLSYRNYDNAGLFYVMSTNIDCCRVLISTNYIGIGFETSVFLDFTKQKGKRISPLSSSLILVPRSGGFWRFKGFNTAVCCTSLCLFSLIQDKHGNFGQRREY